MIDPVTIVDIAMYGRLWRSPDLRESRLTGPEWIELFGMAGGYITGFEGFADTGRWPDPQLSERPDETLTMFRGCDPAFLRPSAGVGMSWTRSPEYAESYAWRRSPRGRVYVAEVEPWRLLCHTASCARANCCVSEYVVNVTGLAVGVYRESARPVSDLLDSPERVKP